MRRRESIWSNRFTPLNAAPTLVGVLTPLRRNLRVVIGRTVQCFMGGCPLGTTTHYEMTRGGRMCPGCRTDNNKEDRIYDTRRTQDHSGV